MRICTHTVYSGYTVMCQHNAAAEKQGCLHPKPQDCPRTKRRAAYKGAHHHDSAAEEAGTLCEAGIERVKDASAVDMLLTEQW